MSNSLAIICNVKKKKWIQADGPLGMPLSQGEKKSDVANIGPQGFQPRRAQPKKGYFYPHEN